MKRILFQGDSITDSSRNREDFYSTGGGYPKLVKVALGMKAIGEYECLNRGILGNTIRDLYGRRREDIFDLAPDYLSLYIGVNDVWLDIDHQSGTDTPEFEALYRALLGELEACCPHTKVMLLAPFVLPGSATCREEDPHRWERFFGGVAEKAEAVKRIGKERGLPVIDLQRAFDEACQKAPASYWTWDGVHPSAYGHEIIKGLWLSALEQIKESSPVAAGELGKEEGMDTVKVEKNSAKLIAHRGLSSIERENTNAAFVAAANRSYYGIETDVHRTADGEFVIVHDNDLKRVAGEDLAVETSSLSQLQSVVLLDKDGEKSRADLRVSTLQNYLSICKCYQKHAVLELKSSFTEEELENMIGRIRELDYLDRVTFISFHWDNLVLLRKQLPEQSAQYLFKEMTREVVDLLVAHRIDADVYYKALTKEWVELLHEKGRKVNCWTVDRKESAEELIAWGVDYITTNILE